MSTVNKNRKTGRVMVDRVGDRFSVKRVPEITNLDFAQVCERVRQLEEEIGFLEYRQEELADAIASRKDELTQLKQALGS
ncbi:MAG: hypothetical protein ACYDDN_06445 [Candidatus Desulforudaceae bacterium]